MCGADNRLTGCGIGMMLTATFFRHPSHHLALLTMGEGYHNFHHQFPMDYRNAIKWYQFDPTKWFIAACGAFGLASHLRVFPENEIRKGALAMQLKRLKKVQDGIGWPVQVDDLPVVSWDKCEYSFGLRSASLYPNSRLHGFARLRGCIVGEWDSRLWLGVAWDGKSRRSRKSACS